MTSTLAFLVPCPILPCCPPRRAPAGLCARPAARAWHRKRARTSLWRMCDASPADEPVDEPDADALSSIQDHDWREFRAALVVGSNEALEEKKEKAYRKGHWAHPLSTPETGCFLASHPAYYRRSALYLTQAVVFLTKYEEGVGATGLVLNRPMLGTVAELEKDGNFGFSSNLASTVLGSQPVYIGGPDQTDSVHLSVLHSNSTVQVDGTQEPHNGVFLTEAEKFVANSKDMTQADAANARLFMGCIRWEPGELESEVSEGSWYCIAASPMFALKHCIQLPKPLWVEIMQNQGMPFAKIATQVYEEENEPDKGDD